MLRTISRTARRQFTTTRPFYKIIPEAVQTTPGKRPGDIDQGETVRNPDRGTNSAMINTDLSDGILETNKPADWSVDKDKTGAPDVPMLHKDGAIGKEFKSKGSIGQIGEQIGGAFSSDGAIGKNFKPDGAIGSTVHENLGRKD